jgi:hypothetical protein
MRHGDQFIPPGMLEGVVIATHSIKLPSVFLQHPDQLAAVSFYAPLPKHLPKTSRALNARSIGANPPEVG